MILEEIRYSLNNDERRDGIGRTWSGALLSDDMITREAVSCMTNCINVHQNLLCGLLLCLY